MMRSVILEIRLSDGSVRPSELKCAESPPWWIECDYDPIVDHRFTADNLFACLVELRRALEAVNCRILCNGSRVDTRLSNMALQSGGTHVYLLRLGIRPSLDESLDILAPSAAETIGTIAEQEEFHSRWQNSLRRSP
jgi:hypothetical protein